MTTLSLRCAASAFVLAVFASVTAPPTQAAAPAIERIDLFEAGVGGYAYYRVPGLVVTAKGTVLAYCEARLTGKSDWENVDVLLRRSTDGGRTWATPRKISGVDGPRVKNPVALERGKALAEEITYSNPVAIAGRDGSVHFLFCLEFNRCFHLRSDDDGVTFSPPVEITADIEKFRPLYDWKVFAAGPMHGIELKNGRLVVAVWLALGTAGSGFHPSVVSTIYSEDHGKSWKCGDIAIPNTDEWANPNSPAVAELSDGRVMINTRSESKPNRRLVTISPNGATGWSRPQFDDTLVEPISEGSLFALSAKASSDKSRLLFANPANLTNANGKEAPGKARDRKNLSVKLSYDDGQTWPVSKTLEPGESAFSDLSALPDGTILCLYEAGNTRGEKSFAGHNVRYLTLARFNLEWLTDGKDAMPAKK
jgi:sialidase-1